MATPRSVNKSWAVLFGRSKGDPDEAANFLSSLSPERRKALGRVESRQMGRLRSRMVPRIGDRPKTRWAV